MIVHVSTIGYFRISNEMPLAQQDGAVQQSPHPQCARSRRSARTVVTHARYIIVAYIGLVRGYIPYVATQGTSKCEVVVLVASRALSFVPTKSEMAKNAPKSPPPPPGACPHRSSASHAHGHAYPPMWMIVREPSRYPYREKEFSRYAAVNHANNILRQLSLYVYSCMEHTNC